MRTQILPILVVGNFKFDTRHLEQKRNPVPLMIRFFSEIWDQVLILIILPDPAGSGSCAHLC